MARGKRKARSGIATVGAARAKRSASVAKKRVDVPYHLARAEISMLDLREMVVVKLARYLEETGWTQTQMAKHLGVSQPRISDLVRGQTHKFTLDTLLQMLMALGKTVHLSVDDTASSTTPDGAPAAQEAVCYYSRVLELEPESGAAYMNRGNAYLTLKEYALAIGDFSRAHELEPQRPGPLNNRALAYRQMGQLKAALKDCEKLNKLHPDYSHGFAQKGDVLITLERLPEAVSAFTQAITLDPNRPGYYMNRATVFEAMGQFGKAFMDYAQTIKVDPTYEPAREAARVLRQRISAEPV